MIKRRKSPRMPLKATGLPPEGAAAGEAAAANVGAMASVMVSHRCCAGTILVWRNYCRCRTSWRIVVRSFDATKTSRVQSGHSGLGREAEPTGLPERPQVESTNLDATVNVHGNHDSVVRHPRGHDAR